MGCGGVLIHPEQELKNPQIKEINQILRSQLQSLSDDNYNSYRSHFVDHWIRPARSIRSPFYTKTRISMNFLKEVLKGVNELKIGFVSTYDIKYSRYGIETYYKVPLMAKDDYDTVVNFMDIIFRCQQNKVIRADGLNDGCYIDNIHYDRRALEDLELDIEWRLYP